MSSVAIAMALTVLMMVVSCGAKFSVRCSDHTNITTSLTAAPDGVRGRYVLEFCTDVTPDDARWQIDLYYGRKNYSVCPTKWNKDFLTHRHSGVEEYIYKLLPSCSHVCLSKEMDLLFNACYCVQNSIREHGTFLHISYHNISNAYTRDAFFHWDVVGIAHNHGDYVNLHLNLKNMPTADVTLLLSKPNPGDSQHVVWTKDITTNCSYAQYEIFCTLWGLDASWYNVTVDASRAPWTRGEFSERWRRYDFEVSAGGEAPGVEAYSPARAALQWAGGALAAGAAGALLLLAALRLRRAGLVRKHVLRDWLDRVDRKTTSGEVLAPSGPVLLLYARECLAAEPVVAALKALLTDTGAVAPDQLYDIGSPATLALAASGGGSWVRAVMSRADARVLLLQTPALQALHVPRLAGDSGALRLEQPLLSSRVAYRAPAACDWLLPFALSLLAHSAHAPHALPYRKYFLATLEGLETEALPYAVPFRRYVLPRHARALLQDLRPPAPTEQPEQPNPSVQHQIDLLAHAAVGFLDYARANPDYLMEELLVLS